MAWNYDPTKLSDAALGPLMQVRLNVGDTNTADQQLQDEEIAFFLADEPSTLAASARAAEAIAAKYAREVTTKGGGADVELTKLLEQYTKLGRTLRARARRNVAPYAGGISVSDKQNIAADTDRVAPGFFVGMDENTGTISPAEPSALILTDEG